MQGIDAILHANPYATDIKGLLAIYNPTQTFINTSFTFDTYYVGIQMETYVYISHEGGTANKVNLQNGYYCTLNISMNPMSITWYLLMSNP